MSLPPEWDHLRVNVSLALDHAITSKAMATIAREEAAAIWRPYGVDLQWTGAGTQAALSLEVIVDPGGTHVDTVGMQAVLGVTPVVALELGWIVRNSSLSELLFSGGRVTLSSFNALPHLPDPAHWTYR